MVPHLRRVVAGGATPWDRRQADHVVEPPHPGDVDALSGEERLAPGGPRAPPCVAPFDWCERSSRMVMPASVSRPSHITPERKPRLAEGSGRRKSDSSRELAKPYGSSAATSSNSAPAGTSRPTRMSPLLRSML